MELLSKVLFICAVSLLNSGCSLIGFTIGKISDSRTPPFTQISYPDTQAVIEQTRAITLALKSGQEISESQINNSCNGALEGFLAGEIGGRSGYCDYNNINAGCLRGLFAQLTVVNRV